MGETPSGPGPDHAYAEAAARDAEATVAKVRAAQEEARQQEEEIDDARKKNRAERGHLLGQIDENFLGDDFTQGSQSASLPPNPKAAQVARTVISEPVETSNNLRQQPLTTYYWKRPRGPESVLRRSEKASFAWGEFTKGITRIYDSSNGQHPETLIKRIQAAENTLAASLNFSPSKQNRLSKKMAEIYGMILSAEA